MSTPSYVGFKPCGCCVAAVVDDGKYPEDTAKSVAAFIRKGLKVKRKDTDFVKANLRSCQCGKTKDLFEDEAWAKQ
jgi:hypothetical protein